MNRFPVLLLAAAVALVSALSSARAGDESLSFNKSYAIVVGIDGYSGNPELPALNYAVKDARAVAEFLQSQGFEVTTFFDGAARRDAIITRIESLGKEIGGNDRFVFFFAGHGHTETFSGGQMRGYLVPFDGKGSSSTYLSMPEIRDLASDVLGAARHQLYLLDCCFGGLLKTRAPVDHINPEIKDYIKEVTKRQAREVLTAGGANQRVQDGGLDGHSVFTAELLNALREGYADTDGDGFVTFLELARYIQKAASRPNQTPGVDTLEGHQQGEFVFRNPKWSRGHDTAENSHRSVDESTTRGRPTYLLVKDAKEKWMAGNVQGARPLLREAADLGNVEAMFLLGVQLVNDDKNYEEGLKLVREAANRGWLQAMKHLEEYYSRSDNINLVEVTKWKKEIAGAEFIAEQTAFLDPSGTLSKPHRTEIPPEKLRLIPPSNAESIIVTQ